MDNFNNANTVKCTVIRLGVVMVIHEQCAVIEVSDKLIEIARDKIADNAAIGDEVRWDGRLWSVHESR
ncbi:hypothetical protein [Paenibacillus sp. OV219]|uniref:hypothetical protein n=1 Tax=Paenibacillus sp. OV219 TaxID=1884377 RepID=UPI0008C44929|nr:hypothetical protein [Paenibacillus sp. OV219]SEM87719.1 hypothetical protein SAMN05518847_1011027 [Paenibacillus sp. OV219]